MTKTTKNQPVKFIHTADWHVRDTQYGRGFRGEDFRIAIRQIVRIAESEKVDFIINGGDTLHINRPSGSMLDFLFEIDAELKRIGIPMYVVTGNHDAANPSFLTFPGYRRESGGTGIVCIDDQVVTHGDLVVAGFPARPWQEVKEIMDGWDKPADIVCWHGAVDAFVPFPMESAWTFGEMPEGKCKAYLLGDIHLRARKRLPGGTLVSYPGPPELCDRGEPADKYVDIYELEPGWRDKPFPEPSREWQLETRPVLFLRVDDAADADKAVVKIQQEVLKCRGRIPMVFMSYNRMVKDVIGRILNLIDRSKTIFRFRILGNNSGYRYGNTEPVDMSGGRKNVRPDLMATVDEVVPPGTPLNPLAKELADPLKDTRQSLSAWIDEQLVLADGEPLVIEVVKPLDRIEVTVDVAKEAGKPDTCGMVVPGLEWVAEADAVKAKAAYTESRKSDTTFEL